MANNSIPTGTDFIKGLVKRVNEVSDRIHSLNISKDQLESEIKIYRTELTAVNSTLNYSEKVNKITDGLDSDIKSVQDFFVVPDGESPDPAQIDLSPANKTLQDILSSSRGVANRLYQCIVNCDVCVRALDNTQQQLLTAMGTSNNQPAADPNDPYGHLSFSLGPEGDLVGKLKQAVATGLKAMETLANTYLKLLTFIQRVEEVYQECIHLNASFNTQLRLIKKFDDRNENRISVYKSRQKELNRDLNSNQSELDKVVRELHNLEIDYQMLKAEYDSANQSIRPAKKVEVAAAT